MVLSHSTIVVSVYSRIDTNGASSPQGPAALQQNVMGPGPGGFGYDGMMGPGMGRGGPGVGYRGRGRGRW